MEQNYSDRLPAATGYDNVEYIISACQAAVTDDLRQRPWMNSEIGHGINLLHSPLALDCYMAAYGEMHQHKMQAALQNFPFEHINEACEIVDWGCGQGIGAMCVVEAFKQRQLLPLLKRVSLIEPSYAALQRAECNVRYISRNSVTVMPINKYLPNGTGFDELPYMGYRYHTVIHIFSNILDVNGLRLKSIARMVASSGKRHIVMCVGTMNAGAGKIDSFCQIFGHQSFFSNISSTRYAVTKTTGHPYTCKTKCFVYDDEQPLDLSVPEAQNTPESFGEYDVNLQIQNGQLSEDKAWVKYMLDVIMAPNDILYSAININDTFCDFLLFRPGIGLLIINVVENDITQLDGNGRESIMKLLDECQHAIIDNIPSIHHAVESDSRKMSLVKKMLVCVNNNNETTEHTFRELKHVYLYGSELIAQIKQNKSYNLFKEIKFFYHSPEINDNVKQELSELIPADWHLYREGCNYNLTTAQKRLTVSEAGKQQKIRGVAGSGKTQVLACRAVAAQLRTGGDVLVLVFNKTLVNYMHTRVNDVKADFPWSKITIDYYHRFFRKQAAKCNKHVSTKDGIFDYDNEHFFDNDKDKLPKYEAIFVDEVQDFDTAWLKLLRHCFLSENGEFVVFGDPKQNIYHRPLDNKVDIKLDFIKGPWVNSLKDGQRFANPQLVDMCPSPKIGPMTIRLKFLTLSSL